MAPRHLLIICLVALLAIPPAVGASVPRRPTIVSKPIPFPPERRAEMAAYSKRHYAIASWRLVRPRVIVQHYTASTTFSSAYWTFASDEPDAELHEKPGVCAHFVIDRDGTIYQLVPLSTMCRHTVGLNFTAIGIEHVGTSDRGVLDNGAQMRSSLALTAWLMGRYRIQLGDVIGHNESLTSPYHRERYPGWRCQTHGDFPRVAMDEYRGRLAKVASAAGVALGRRTHRVRSSC
ncbi:MAG: peptidoglycan recognition family protein [Gaiellales bacterium]